MDRPRSPPFVALGILPTDSRSWMDQLFHPKPPPDLSQVTTLEHPPAAGNALHRFPAWLFTVAAAGAPSAA